MNIQTEQNSDIDVKNKLDIIVAKNVDVFYGSKQALENITIDIPENQVTSLIGPVSYTHLTLPTNREV